MPQIEIRPVLSADLHHLVAMDHSVEIQYVWQMERLLEEGQVTIGFREVRLPRVARLQYPRSPTLLLQEWSERSGGLIALLGGKPVGYLTLSDSRAPATAWVLDLVVDAPFRRQGIASALLLAAESWALPRGLRKIVLEMSSKNTPAIHLALKAGYEFSGFHDRYYANQDIALFFSRLLR